VALCPAQDPEQDLAENPAYDPQAGDQTGQQSAKVKKKHPDPDWHRKNPDVDRASVRLRMRNIPAFDPRAGNQTGQQNAKVKKTSGSGLAQKELGQCPAQDAEPG
jgi:hypothetical protein